MVNDLRQAAEQMLEVMHRQGYVGVDEWIAAEKALRAALAEQPAEQEPFGYLWPTGTHPEFRFTQQERNGVDGMPVYTAPQPRREAELPDDAITHMAAQSLLYEENPPQGFDAAVRSFARAVIKAYKEKQGEKT